MSICSLDSDIMPLCHHCLQVIVWGFNICLSRDVLGAILDILLIRGQMSTSLWLFSNKSLNYTLRILRIIKKTSHTNIHQDKMSNWWFYIHQPKPKALTGIRKYSRNGNGWDQLCCDLISWWNQAIKVYNYIIQHSFDLSQTLMYDDDTESSSS